MTRLILLSVNNSYKKLTNIILPSFYFECIACLIFIRIDLQNFLYILSLFQNIAKIFDSIEASIIIFFKYLLLVSKTLIKVDFCSIS